MNCPKKSGVGQPFPAIHFNWRSGIQPFCITIDTHARDYLPLMYGAANYVVIDEVGKLPLEVANIYRRLTV